MKLIEALAGLMISGVVIAIALPGCVSMAQVRENAEANLEQFAAASGGNSVSCAAEDTDSNGRVGCTMKLGAILTPVECSVRLGGGCLLDTRQKIVTPIN